MVKTSNKDSLKQPFIVRRQHVVGLALIGLAIACILAVSQIIFSSTSVYTNGESAESNPVIDYHDAPLIGSSEASYIVTVLFDYQCAHCQKIHFLLKEAVRRYKGKLAFALCPTPLNNECNPYIPKDVEAFKNSCELARIGLAVWKANPEVFPAFDDWMFTYNAGRNTQSIENAKAKATEWIGESRFNTAMANPWINTYMQSCTQLFGQTLKSGKGGIPKLIFKSRWVVPEANNTEGLIRILQKVLHLPKP